MNQFLKPDRVECSRLKIWELQPGLNGSTMWVSEGVAGKDTSALHQTPIISIGKMMFSDIWGGKNYVKELEVTCLHFPVSTNLHLRKTLNFADQSVFHLSHLLGWEKTYFWHVQILPNSWELMEKASFSTNSSSDFVFRTKKLRWKQSYYDCSGETCFITESN